MKKVLLIVSLFLMPASLLSVDVVFFNDTCQDAQVIVHPECATCSVVETAYALSVGQQSSSSFKIQQAVSKVEVIFNQNNGYLNGRTFITPIDTSKDKVILSIERTNKQLTLSKMTEEQLEAKMKPENQKHCMSIK